MAKGESFTKERTQEVEQILTERFGKDTVIALAAAENGAPSVRNVKAIPHKNKAGKKREDVIK